MIQILYGNEPFLIAHYKNKAIKALENKEFSYAEFSVADEEFYSFIGTVSFFGRKLAVINPATLQELDNEKFRKALQSDVADILILPAKIRRDTKFYKWCDKNGYVKKCDKVTQDTLINMILREIKRCDGKIREDAILELIRRSHYETADEVSLYDVLGDVRNITCYSKEVTLETVRLFCADREKEDIFILSSLLLKKDIAGVRRQAELIEKSGTSAIAVLSAMLRDFRVAYKMKALEKSIPNERERKAAVGTWNMPSASGSLESLYRQMEIILSAIDDIKTGRIASETAILLTVMKLAYL